MHIDRIDMVHVRIPLHAPFKISSGTISETDALVIAIYSEGLIGYGEAAPMAGSFYSEDSPESTWDCLHDQIIPKVLAHKNMEPVLLQEVLDGIEENSFAKAGIETAFWDLDAKRQGLPLFELLGGKAKRIPSGLAVGICPTINEVLETIDRYLGEGYKRLKIKIERGWDLEPVKMVRKHFPDIPLMVDANAAYTRADISLFRKLDEFDLMMFEQPLPKSDLEGHAELQSNVRTPVCLDESAIDLRAVEKAIEMESCKIINIKIQRMGGLAKAKQVHDLCQRAGLPVWAGTMPELGIGSAQAIHLATLPNFSYPTDVESSSRWFIDDIIEPRIQVKDGWIEVPDGVGYGFAIDEKKIRKYAIRSETFR